MLCTFSRWQPLAVSRARFHLFSVSFSSLSTIFIQTGITERTLFYSLRLFTQVLMEATPTFLDYTDIMGIFMQVDGVVRVHNLRLWSLSINKNALSAHLAIGN